MTQETTPRRRQFSNDELAKCARREVGMRRTVYARRGLDHTAELEIAMMDEIAWLLEMAAVRDQERDKPELPL
jgi:hypothetical protein